VILRPALAAGAAFLALSACQVADEEHGPAAGAAAPSASTAADPPATSAFARSPAPPSETFAIRSDRDLADLVPGCPGMNPQHRPRGSN